MSAGFVDLSSKADVTTSILKQQLEEAEDLDVKINAAETELLDHTKAGTVTPVAILNVAIPLVNSKSVAYIERGVFKLVELLRDSIQIDKEVGFCALYHLALGHYKLGDERTALGEVQSLLEAKSFHTSALALKQICINKMISKQKGSGLFSRLLRKKEDTPSQQHLTAPLAFLSTDEKEKEQDEADRAALARMFPSNVPGQDIDIDAMNRALANDPFAAARASTPGFSSTSPSGDSQSSGAPSSSHDSSIHDPYAGMEGIRPRDSYLSDTLENGTMRASMPADYNHHPSSTMTTSLPGSVVLGHAGAGDRGSMWVRSKPGKDLGPEAGFVPAARTHDSLPTSLVRRMRPLRASQSARSAPSAEYLSKLTVTGSSSTPGTPSIADEEEEEEEEFELEEYVAESRPLFEYEPYCPNPEISKLEAAYAGMDARQAQEAEALATLIRSDIDRCKQEYQALLQTHQTEQYDLLRVQQAAVATLQEDQLAALAEERELMALPPEERNNETLQALQTRMKELTDRQSPLLAEQQAEQAKLVADQQAAQLERQEAFKALIAAHTNRKNELKSAHEIERTDSPLQLANLKQSDMEAYLAQKAEAEETFYAIWEQEQAVKRRKFEEAQLAELQALRDARDAARAERLRAKQAALEEEARERARLAEEERLRKEEETRLQAEYARLEAERLENERQQAAEVEAARVAAAEAETARLEQQRRDAEALAAQQAEEARVQEELRLQQEAELQAQQARLERERLELEKQQETAQRAADEASQASQTTSQRPNRPAPAGPPPTTPGTLKTAASANLSRPAVAATPPPAMGPKGTTPTASFKMPKQAASATLRRAPGEQTIQSPSPPLPTATDAAAIPSDSDVIDVFAITKGAAKPPATMAGKPSALEQIARTSIAAVPAPLGSTPTFAPPPVTPPPASAAANITSPIAKMPPKGPPPTLPPTAPPSTGPPPSNALPPVPVTSPPTNVRAPAGPPPNRPPPSALPSLPSGPPPSLPPSGPPSLPSGPPPSLPSGPPPSTPSSTVTSPPSGRPAPPPGARPQPPTATVSANLAAFNEKPNYARPAPPMPTVAKGPPVPRVPPPAAAGPSSNAGPPMPATGKGAPPPTPTITQTTQSSAPPSSGFYGPPPGSTASSTAASTTSAPYSLSEKELKNATSSDTTKGVSKDKHGLPVSKTTLKGAHLLGAASKAKGPSRRPPSTMVNR